MESMSRGDWLGRLGLCCIALFIMVLPLMFKTQQPRAASPLCSKIDDEMADVMRIRNAMDQLSAQAKANKWDYQKFMDEVIKLLSGTPDGGTGKEVLIKIGNCQKNSQFSIRFSVSPNHPKMEYSFSYHLL